jgi:hypothetical protein
MIAATDQDASDGFYRTLTVEGIRSFGRAARIDKNTKTSPVKNAEAVLAE